MANKQTRPQSPKAIERFRVTEALALLEQLYDKASYIDDERLAELETEISPAIEYLRDRKKELS